MAGGAGLYRTDSSDGGTGKTVSGTPAKDNGTSTFTVTVGGMTINEHVGKGCTFTTAPNNVYTIVSNTADTVTVQGDASGEAADDGITIQRFQTIMGALTQLRADEDGAAFTATQVIEVYTGSGNYLEQVQPDATLVNTFRYWLHIEAAAGQSPVIDGEDVRTYGIYTVDRWTKITGIRVTRCTYGFRSSNAEFYSCEADNCSRGGQWLYGCRFYDCYFHDNAVGDAMVSSNSEYRRCRFFSVGGSSSSNWEWSNKYYDCIFVCATYGLNFLGGTEIVHHCVFYGCGKAVTDEGYGRTHWHVRNCIFLNCGYNFYCSNAASPGGDVEYDSDSNCFYNWTTAFAQVQGVNKTLAEWKALGHDEHSKEGDPLFEDAAGGDFTPKKASPATALCPPCGVKYDYNGKPFRLTRCNAGAIETDWTRKFGS